MSFAENLSRLRLIARQSGPLGALRFGWRHFRERVWTVDVAARYGFVSAPPFGALPERPEPGFERTVNWIVPVFFPGSGGHYTAFRLVKHLEGQGFRCRIALNAGMGFASAAAAKDAIHKHFLPLDAEVYLRPEDMPPANTAIATGWHTAYTLRRFQGARHKVYLVQDFEPYFTPPGSEYALAEATYRFGFTGVTAGGWLADVLARDYGMETHAFGFSADRALYRPDGPAPGRRPGVRRVLFYARPITPRRGFELGLLALQHLCARMPDVEVVFVGWDLKRFRIPFRHVDAGVVPMGALPDLYRSCDAALVLSFTNLSLLPLELMACGVPVVSNRGPNVEWLLTPDNSVLAEPSVEGLSDAVADVLEDGDRRARLIASGLERAARADAATEAEVVAGVLRALSDTSRITS
ncbi:glycosyltransferase family 4 protein [Azospirillum sp.]|uniref:glycosyltransferase family 4 protein n=1 Tax=Azospirillum sp. TaxID=34012 RepID=UPI002D2AA839|nr:glycosyltransferase family 4 protein [Azospirillum sp.]HYD71242.1 glycosyltransferase family 4 protein [Azospirillum sp.]